MAHKQLENKIKIWIGTMYHNNFHKNLCVFGCKNILVIDCRYSCGTVDFSAQIWKGHTQI